MMYLDGDQIVHEGILFIWIYMTKSIPYYMYEI